MREEEEQELCLLLWSVMELKVQMVLQERCVMGAPCRKMDPKVPTAPRTQSPLTIKVVIKIKFNSRIKR